jgi:hypothetical protein
MAVYGKSVLSRELFCKSETIRKFKVCFKIRIKITIDRTKKVGFNVKLILIVIFCM